MRRKVTLHGPATLSVSLPLKWARKNNIKKGDDVEVVEQKSQLVISKDTVEGEKKEISVDIPNLEGRLIMFLVRDLYISGYTTITLRFKSTHTFHDRVKKEVTIQSLISREVRRLMGLEVVSISEDSCTMKCMVKESSEEFDQSIRRSFLLLKDMFSVLQKAVEEGSDSLTQVANDTHDQITTFISYNLRTLGKIGYKDAITTMKLYNYLFKLDDILDIAKYMYREIAEYVPLSRMKEITRQFQEHFDLSYHLYYEYDLEKEQEIRDLKIKMDKEVLKLYKKATEQERRYLHFVESIVEETFKLNRITMSLVY